jgi:tetratricopeptide (TPR) repeat protein
MSRGVEAWERRKGLVIALAGLGAALTPVLALLGGGVASLASLGAGLLGAALTLAVEMGRSGAARRREEAKLYEQSHVDVQPVDQVDPIAIGVDPASREVTRLAGDLPDYLRRDADGEVDEALGGALDNTGRWMVVVYGLPKVGKSRTLFEALRRIHREGKYDLRLVAPTDANSLRALLERIDARRSIRSRRVRHVLWLDDLETFVGERIGLKELQAWRRKNAIVVATYGGKGSERDLGPKSEWIGALADKIMSLARQVGLQRTTPEELERLPASLAGVSRDIAAKYGLAAALVAADALELKLKQQQHGAMQPKCPAGAAIVYAAISWARCGRNDPISEERLGRLWTDYMDDDAPDPEPGDFDKGLDWAVDPVAGRIALLERVGEADTFRAFDYIRGFAASDPQSPPISEGTWREALATDDPAQLFSVGVAARAAKRLQDAERAFAAASEEGDGEIAAAANFNLGVLQQERNESEPAEKSFRRAAALGSSEAFSRLSGPPDHVRAAIEEQLRTEGMLDGEAEIKWGEDVYRDEVERGNGRAADELGVALMERGEAQEAEEMFRKALELGFTPAAVNLGVLFEEMGDPAGAEAAYREAAKADVVEGAFNLGVLLKDKGDLRGSEEALRQAAKLGHGAGASNLGILLEQRGDLDGAEEAYRRAMELGFPSAATSLGMLLERRGRMAEAEEYLRQGADQGDMGGAIGLARLLLEQGRNEEARETFGPVASAGGTDTALLFAVLLDELGDVTAAEVAYREAVSHGIDIAAFKLGRLLEAQGRDAEAREAFERAEELGEGFYEGDEDFGEDDDFGEETPR